MAETTPKPTKTQGGKIPFRKRLGEYIIQLSVVVVGILITFQGSSLISDMGERREVRNTLSMVRQELEKNLVELDRIERYVEAEDAGVVYMSRFIARARQMPQDSIHKYLPVLTTSSRFKFQSHSLEVLKNISHIHAIKDKELIRDLFITYEALDEMAGNLNEYYTMKRAVTQDFFFGQDIHMTEKIFSGEFYPFFDAYAQNNSTRNFLINAHGNIAYVLPGFAAIRERAAQTIKKIDTEIKR